MTRILSRRNLLGNALAIGCTAAASPFATPVTLARAPGDNRLVVIILRGGFDALDLIQPVGDPSLRRLRTQLSLGADGGATPLDNFFMAHPSLGDLMPLWQAGELSFAHAVSTPYRNKRSHFDGQDLLENGSGATDGSLTRNRDGWLNRMLSLMPGARAETALAVGRGNMLLLSGDAPHSSWTPDAELGLSPQAELLLDLMYRGDPLFHAASQTALALAAETTGGGMSARVARQGKALAEFAAQQLADEARVAAFSINGWDTHQGQSYHLPRAVRQLSQSILALKAGLGPAWDKTAVLCMTEFGRTARENGNGGTDHGTGGGVIMAGGALRAAKVHGTWPGLGDGQLFNDRDLMPTADVRGYAAWAMRDLFGLAKSDLENTVFPGLDMGSSPGLIG